MNMASMCDEYEISADSSRLDIACIHDFLSQSYWAKGIPRDVVERSIAHSLCFGVYRGKAQVGFARVITDQATFAYLADVFILETHRGKGLATRLVQHIQRDARLQGLRRFLLITKDAHAVYAPLGFAPITEPERFMDKRNVQPYAHLA